MRVQLREAAGRAFEQALRPQWARALGRRGAAEADELRFQRGLVAPGRRGIPLEHQIRDGGRAGAADGVVLHARVVDERAWRHPLHAWRRIGRPRRHDQLHISVQRDRAAPPRRVRAARAASDLLRGRKRDTTCGSRAASDRGTRRTVARARPAAALRAAGRTCGSRSRSRARPRMTAWAEGRRGSARRGRRPEPRSRAAAARRGSGTASRARSSRVSARGGRRRRTEGSSAVRSSVSARLSVPCQSRPSKKIAVAVPSSREPRAARVRRSYACELEQASPASPRRGRPRSALRASCTESPSAVRSANQLERRNRATCARSRSRPRRIRPPAPHDSMSECHGMRVSRPAPNRRRRPRARRRRPSDVDDATEDRWVGQAMLVEQSLIDRSSLAPDPRCSGDRSRRR